MFSTVLAFSGLTRAILFTKKAIETEMKENLEINVTIHANCTWESRVVSWTICGRSSSSYLRKTISKHKQGSNPPPLNDCRGCSMVRASGNYQNVAGSIPIWGLEIISLRYDLDERSHTIQEKSFCLILIETLSQFSEYVHLLK